MLHNLGGNQSLAALSSVHCIQDFYETTFEGSSDDAMVKKVALQNPYQDGVRSNGENLKTSRHSSVIGCSQHENISLTKTCVSDLSSHSEPSKNDNYLSNQSKIPLDQTNPNRRRLQRRKEQLQLVTDDLIDLVCEIYSRESKVLLFPSGCDPVKEWGNGSDRSKCDSVSVGEDRDNNDFHGLDSVIVNAIRNFVMTLPSRYSLSVENPGEVLVHMRLISVVKSNPVRAAVDVINLENNTHLVTLCCRDLKGVLSYITNLLCSGANQILDTNCMLTSENINLIRMVVDINSPLHLDKLQQYLDFFLLASKGLLSVNPNNMGGIEHPQSKEEDNKTINLSELPISEQIGCADLMDIQYHSFDRGDTVIQECNLEMKDASPSELLFENLHSNDGCLDKGSKKISHSNTPISLNEIINRHDIDIYEDIGHNSSRSMTCLLGEPSSQIKKKKRLLLNRPNSSDLGLSVDGLSDILSHQSNSYSQSQYSPKDIIVDGVIRVGTDIKIYRGYFHPLSKEGEHPLKDDDNSKDPTSTKLYAIKVAVSDTLDGDDTLQALIKEGQLVKKLQHVNVCRILDIISVPECVCLAYEYCAGGTLESLIQDKSRMYDFLPYVIDIANGMSYLHSLSIIHRDLKPSNIFLDHRNQVKIGDFGMSIEHKGEYLSGETGTYRWMAPEVIRHEHYSINADIYSFGIIFWQLVTRNPKPYSEVSPIQAAFAATKGERPIIPPVIPNFLKHIITLCWDDDQFKRPSFANLCMSLNDYAHKTIMLADSTNSFHIYHD